ncbi:uncharacterized protein UTRI_05055 [Ustilago trichophora]|uniref:TTI1 C-terminal TPR domain-containing protein n=1 Tax=Ustilago trichophora TaxID=86804 RepID=A0A5C3EBA9_9BASI|nr:uncharacterized protein UTRI_05055 [Ustilago trichophora]
MFSSGAAGPFQQGHPSSSTHTPFQRLKPVCVELLSLTGRATGAAKTQQVLLCLRRLKTILRETLSDDNIFFSSNPPSDSASTLRRVPYTTEPTLTPSLINYVFYPLSELISAAPKGITSLPDSVVELTLDVLALLCSQWWAAWASETAANSSQGDNRQWQVWCDLLILSSSVLGSPSSKDAGKAEQQASSASDEVKIAAMKVLSELLSPRFKGAHSLYAESGPITAQEDEWEWDGVSDLPSLDENIGLADNRRAPQSSKAKVENAAKSDPILVFPTPKHFAYATTDRVAKGAISFVLSSSFAIAESSQECTEARSSAIGVASHALLLWIGGTCPLPFAVGQQCSGEATWLDIPSLHNVELPRTPASTAVQDGDSAPRAAAQRLRPLLPGITSSLTRLATSRLRSRQDGIKQKPTPSAVAAGAIRLLGDLFRATLSDECLRDAIAHQEPLGLTQSQAGSSGMSTQVTDLEDFAELNTNEDQLTETLGPSPEDKNEPTDDDTVASEYPTNSVDKDARWALSTLAQVHLALKTFSPLTQPSLPGTSLPSSVHSSVQIAILRLAVVLLSECADSFFWLDGQLEGMARLDATSNNADSSDSSSSSIVNTLLTWIIDLASDTNSDSGAKNAKAAFKILQRNASTHDDGGSALLSRLTDGSALWSVLTRALGSLPSAITAHDDASASRLALRVSTVLKLLNGQSSKQSMTGPASLAKLARDVEKSSVRLIRLLKIEQLNHVEEAGEVPGSTVWRLQPVFATLETSTSSQISRMFFNFGRSLAFSLVQQLKSQPHKAGGKGDVGDVFALITFLIEKAARLRSVRLDVEAHANGSPSEDAARRSESLITLIVAADMLRGVSSCLDNLELGLQFADMGSGAMQASKQARKVAHKLGKKVFSLVMDMLDGDAEEAIASRSQSGVQSRSAQKQSESDSSRDVGLASASSDTMLVERFKGISLASDDIDSTTPDRHGPALDLGFVRAANLSKSSHAPSAAQTQLAIQHRYQQAERTLEQSNALLFALLGSTSKLLGQSFRGLLLRGSYPLISGMSASSNTSSELVRHASASAMKDIAFNTAYADVKNCLLDHADYILGSACQRLISGLDEELRAIASGNSTAGGGSRAAVLKSKIHQGEMVVLPLVSAQRAPFVLVEMIRVLGSEIVPMVEDAIDEILDALDRFHQHTTICDGLLAVLDSILETMAAEQAGKLPNATHKAGLISFSLNEVKRSEMDDFAAWLAARKREQPAFDTPAEQKEASKAEKDDREDKPSKSQQVASQILTKASFFLTHPSPILRSRVLGLLQHGIGTLAPQSRTAELLPIINSAWPFVMTRLGGPSYSHTKSTSSTSKLVPIIDIKTDSLGAADRKDNDAWYRKMEASFVERDPQVWVAAARFVEAAVRHVPDFVGKRVVEDAWPRFEGLLRLMRWKFDPRMGRRHGDGQSARAAMEGAAGDSKALLSSETNGSSNIRVGLIQDLSFTTPQSHTQRSAPTVHTHGDQPFILASATSIPAQLTLCILTTLTSVVRHLNAQMPDEAAWSITTHHHLLDLLDSRQPPSILRAAEELFVELGKRNPEATLWAIQCAFPKAAAKSSDAKVPTPCFMNHARANVHAETLHCIVSSFSAF